MRRRSIIRAAAVVAATGLVALCAGCGANASAGGPGEVVVRIGYQSKTINTVTAGTLLRDLGYFEEALAELGRTDGNTYEVDWQDYPSGPPITAQMLAAAIDIGSMGDYPALVNGAKTKSQDDARSRFVAITGYNLRGSLNGVVVPTDSPARTLKDLAGKAVSTSVGSAGHGMLVSALDREGMAPGDVNITNQEPSVGATALESGQVAALAQFVPWPQLMVYKGTGRMLYDGGRNDLPTMHGVVVREQFTAEHPAVLDAFLKAQIRATQYLRDHPLDAAEKVAEITGLAPEVVYLYNGPGGVVSFDLTIKDPLVEALEADVPFLKSVGSLQELDVAGFIDEGPLRRAYGPDYDADAASTANPSALTGTDGTCGLPAKDPATASELWLDGEDTTHVAATPTCLLRQVKASGRKLRVGYVPDTATGTRMFAATAQWVTDPAAAETARLLPFATLADAEGFVDSHPGAAIASFDEALAAS